MKPIVMYHSNCVDGFTAAYAAWLKFGDDADYMPVAYGSNYDLSICRDRDVYILDFSFEYSVMNSIMQVCNSFTWLDHHKTAFEMWPGADFSTGFFQAKGAGERPFEIILDNNRSGALLAWNYFKHEYNAGVDLVDDYDRWQFEFEETKAFHAGLRSYDFNFDIWHDAFTVDTKAVVEEGRAILRAHNINVEATAKRASACRIEGAINKHSPNGDIVSSESFELKGLIVNCPAHLTSDVGHELATKSGTYGLCWTLGSDKKAKCSLRSNGDYDVSIIAKQFGGGGHKNAAGFEVDIQTLLSWMS